MIGTVVGTYKIVSELGEGGVGTVYKGVDTMLDREVAIKVLRPELVSNESIVERFRSEAITLAKLNHPNIATLFSLFRQGDELFMILEFVQGETVEDILQKRGAIPTEDALPIFCQALNGLNYAHKLQIIHRDIKPSNMILTNDNVLKILDFGIARLLGSSRMTKVGNIIGTLEYMSPEQIRGEETDARSDIYGLGIMLYEILTGRLPFESENEFVLMKAHTEETPALPRSLNPNIPVEIESAIVKAIAKNPDERFQNADEFLQTLLELGFSAGENPAFGFESVYQAKTSATFKKEKEKQFHSKDFPKDIAVEKDTAKTAEAIKVSSKNKSENDKFVPIAINETVEFIPTTGKDSAIPMPTNTEPTIAESAGEIVFSETNEFVPKISKEIKATRLGEPNLPQTEKEIKATRLGANVGSSEVKATRLGVIDAPISVEKNSIFSHVDLDEKPFPASLLEKLNWIHYAGAGAVLFFLFLVIAIVAITPFLFSGGGEESESLANTETINKEDKTSDKAETNTQNDSQTASDTIQESTVLGDSNLEDNGESSQPTPLEVADESGSTKTKKDDEKKDTSRNESGKKKTGGSKKETGGAKTNTGNDKKKTGGGKKIVKDLTKKPPKPSATPGMTDN